MSWVAGSFPIGRISAARLKFHCHALKKRIFQAVFEGNAFKGNTWLRLLLTYRVEYKSGTANTQSWSFIFDRFIFSRLNKLAQPNLGTILSIKKLHFWDSKLIDKTFLFPVMNRVALHFSFGSSSLHN